MAPVKNLRMGRGAVALAALVTCALLAAGGKASDEPPPPAAAADAATAEPVAHSLVPAATALPVLAPPVPKLEPAGLQARLANPPFAGGEVLRYSLAWLSVGGGEMTITTRPPTPYRGRSAYTITLDAKSNDFFSKFFLVKDTIISVVEATRFESMRFEKHTQEGDKVKDVVQIFDLDKRETFWKGNRVKLPAHVLDTLSATWYMRLLDLVPGQSFSVDAHNNGKNYQLKVDVLGRETITVPGGTFRTLQLEPKFSGGFLQKKEGRLLLWVTDDEKRIPVKIRTYLPVGYITASLLAPDQPAPVGKNAFPEEGTTAIPAP